MDTPPVIVVGAINVAATPHPAGIYKRLFDYAATLEVHLHGSDWGKVTPIKEFKGRDGVYLGNVIIWTPIDRRGKWVNKRRGEEATDKEKEKIFIPEEIEPNMRSFLFALDEKSHRIVIEFQNDLGHRFGPQRAKKFFATIFDSEKLWDDAPDVAVSLVPTEDALERVFAIPRLRRLRIRNTVPNDDLGDDADRIQERLKKMGAKSQDIVLNKAAGAKRIEPDEHIKKLAAAGAVDGFVEGHGRDEAGNNVHESTELHPKVIEIKMHGESAFAAFLTAMRAFI